MNILEKIKYTYMLIFLLLLIWCFLIVSLKITYLVLPLLEEYECTYNVIRKNKGKIKKYFKIVPYGLLGSLIAMGIFALIDDPILMGF